MDWVLYVHLVGATVWVGGLITVAALVPAVRQATPDRAVVRVIARRFGVISWTALVVQVLTGVWMVFDLVWTGALITKIGLVLVSALLAGWHSLAARDQSPALRGTVEGVILLLALIIVALALRV